MLRDANVLDGTQLALRTVMLRKSGRASLQHHSQVALAAGLSSIAFGVSIARSRSLVHDDAFVLLRCVRNLLAGDGLVWNVGEAVEGYSSFSMAIFVSLGGVAGLDLLAAARIVNLLAILTFSVWVARFCSRRSGNLSVLAGLVPVLLLWSFSSVATWTCGALEAPLFASVVGVTTCSGWDLLDRPTRRGAIVTGLGLSLTVLTRPEGLFFVAFALVVATFKLQSTLRVLVALLAAAGIPFLAHLVWRYSYYGEWLPNPVYAKLTGLPAGVSRFGWHYVGSFIAQPPFLFAFAIPVAAFAAWRNRTGRGGIVAVLVMAVGFTALVGVGGGDHMPEHRILLPIVALSVVLIGSAVAPLVGRLGSVGAGVLAFALVANSAWTITRLPNNRLDLAAHMGRRVGEHIRDRWPEGTLVALNTAGSVPYFADRYHYIDMLGLVDEHIAHRRIDAFRTPWQSVPGHSKGDGRYVLGRRPDVIILGGPDGWPGGAFLSDVELLESDDFKANYRRVTEVVFSHDELATVTMPVLANSHLRTVVVPIGSFNFTYFERVGAGELPVNLSSR